MARVEGSHSKAQHETEVPYFKAVLHSTLALMRLASEDKLLAESASDRTWMASCHLIGSDGAGLSGLPRLCKALRREADYALCPVLSRAPSFIKF